MAAANEFKLNIFTPGKELYRGTVSEVLLTAHDGETGILPAHEDFIGLLGTGVLKFVDGGNDYWFMISSGVYEVKAGEVTILAEAGETADSVDANAAKEDVKRLEPKFLEKSSFEDDFDALRKDYERAKARIEVHRRTHLVN